MATIATPHLDGALRTVCTMLRRQVPFEHVEAYIDNLRELSDEGRSVLWLYAWCGGHARELRELVSAGEQTTD